MPGLRYEEERDFGFAWSSDATTVGEHYYALNFTSANKCRSIQDASPDNVDETEVQAIFGILYAAVLLVGLSGNLFVVYSILVKRVRFTVRSVFILSLACSDLIIGLSSLPITAIGIFSREWLFGATMCHVSGVVQGGHIFISSFTLVAIAIDRYILIVHALTANLTYNVAAGSVACLWLLGYVAASPVGFFTMSRDELVLGDGTLLCGTFCDEQWPDQNSRMMYGLAVLCVQFGIPLVATTACYIAINNKVKSQVKKRAATQILMPEAQTELSRRRRRTTVMTVTMLASFVLAWLPINLLNVARDFGYDEELGFTNEFQTTFAAAHLVSMTSIVWNPLIYMGFQQSFRNLVTRAATCNDRRSHRLHQLNLNKNQNKPLVVNIK